FENVEAPLHACSTYRRDWGYPSYRAAIAPDWRAAGRQCKIPAASASSASSRRVRKPSPEMRCPKTGWKSADDTETPARRQSQPTKEDVGPEDRARAISS